MSNTPSDAELQALWEESDHPLPQNFARAVLAKWGTPPVMAGEPIAWLSTDCIGERYLCFTKPKDSDPARPLVFGDTTPQPAQVQPVVREPLTDEQIDDLIAAKHFRAGYELTASDKVCINWYRLGLRDGERAHGITQKGGQHGAE